MLTNNLKIVLLGAFLASCSAAYAAPTKLDCSNFQRNADGSWTSLHGFTVAAPDAGPKGLEFRGGLTFVAGDGTVDGLDVGEILDQRCR